MIPWPCAHGTPLGLCIFSFQLRSDSDVRGLQSYYPFTNNSLHRIDCSPSFVVHTKPNQTSYVPEKLDNPSTTSCIQEFRSYTWSSKGFVFSWYLEFRCRTRRQRAMTQLIIPGSPPRCVKQRLYGCWIIEGWTNSRRKRTLLCSPDNVS
jgi:hypothetical protein